MTSWILGSRTFCPIKYSHLLVPLGTGAARSRASTALLATGNKSWPWVLLVVHVSLLASNEKYTVDHLSLTSDHYLHSSHVLQTTTWQDPRKSHSPNSLGSPQQPGSPASGTQTPPGPVDVTKLPLPPGWERAYTPEGEMYFINHVERTTSWFHPSLRAFGLFHPSVIRLVSCCGYIVRACNDEQLFNPLSVLMIMINGW